MLLDITEGHTGLKNNIKARKHDRLLISSWALRIQHRVANVETILHITWPVMPVMMATFLFVLSSPFTSPLAAAAAHWAIFWSWFRFGVSVGSGYTVAWSLVFNGCKHHPKLQLLERHIRNLHSAANHRAERQWRAHHRTKRREILMGRGVNVSQRPLKESRFRRNST